jgi:enolase
VEIITLTGKGILDARGSRNASAGLWLACGSFGGGVAPFGASDGRREAAAFRDLGWAVESTTVEAPAALAGVDGRHQEDDRARWRNREITPYRQHGPQGVLATWRQG